MIYVGDEHQQIYGWRGAINALATAPRIMLGQQTHQDIRVGWIIGAAPLILSRVQEALKGKI